jgi:hypothetical protein
MCPFVFSWFPYSFRTETRLANEQIGLAESRTATHVRFVFRRKMEAAVPALALDAMKRRNARFPLTGHPARTPFLLLFSV